MDQPTTRKEAKQLGTKYYFTGLPCKHGHIALRKTKGSCTECEGVEWRNQADTRRDYFREYAARTDVKERQHEWYMAHKDEVVARADTIPHEKKREYQNNWKAKNIDKVRADTKSRRRKHREATPTWLSAAHKNHIREVYRVAITATKITGGAYVVDHIIPLRSDIVCGLHVPWNLRVMPRQENLLKSNSLPPKEEYLAFPNGLGYTSNL